VQIHFIQRKQFNETNATSNVFQQMPDLKIFSECFRRPHATRGPHAFHGPHAARGPVVGPPM